MRLALASIIQNAKDDMTSGSSEMTSRLLQSMRSFLSANRNMPRVEWIEFSDALAKARPGIAPFYNISSMISAVAKDNSVKDWNDDIAQRLEAIVHDELGSKAVISERFLEAHAGGTILTMSYSGTVLGALTRQKGQVDFNVIVTESLPFGEGRMTASKLAQLSIPVKLVPDSMIGAIVDEIDVCVIGADAIIPSGLVNKVGTRAIAATCMMAGKTVSVLASELKIANMTIVELGRTSKGGEGYPELSQSLEVTPLEMVDEIFTEKRSITPTSLVWK